MISQRGSAMIYLLVAIAMVGILMATIVDDDGGQSAQAQNGSRLISEMDAQISYINAAIQECVLNYTAQDPKLTNTHQKNAPYPLSPDSAYFTAMSATPGPASTLDIGGIRCPGNPGPVTAESQNHVSIFNGHNGRFSPIVPAPMTSWKYYNGTEGVFFWAETSKQDGYLNAALQKLDAKYSQCETDFITNTSSSALTIGADGATCSGRSHCFRYWIIRKAGSVPTDAACP